MSARPGCALVMLAWAVSPGAHADGGRIAIFQPTVITAPGHYVVTRDIAGGSSADTITIDAPDVLLDLNGHLIAGTTLTRSIAILPSASGAPGSVEIRNGRVFGGTNGVWFEGGSAIPSRTRIRLEALEIAFTGGSSPIWIRGAPVVEIVGCHIHDASAIAIVVDPGFPGINPAGVTALIADNVVSEVGGGAIELDGPGLHGVVRDNLLVDFGLWGGAVGISMFSASGTASVIVEGNTIRGGPHADRGIGITTIAGTNAVLDNVITGSNYGIIVTANGNRLSGNVIGSTAVSGIDVHGKNNTLERNVIESGAGDGVVIGSGDGSNLIDSNTIQGHQGFGIRVSFGTGNTYRGNMLRNNVSGAVTGTATDAGGNIP